MTQEYTLPVPDLQPADSIWAWDGSTVHRLSLCVSSTCADHARHTPVLIDSTGMIVNPWEIALWRWPPAAEAVLRRGGYLSNRPNETELWCNCTD